MHQSSEHHENFKNEIQKIIQHLLAITKNDFSAAFASLNLYMRLKERKKGERDVAFMKIYDTIFAQQ